MHTAVYFGRNVLGGLVTGEGMAAGIAGHTARGWEVILANGLVLCVAFIPFFAMKALGRVVGRDKLARLFFRPRSKE